MIGYRIFLGLLCNVHVDQLINAVECRVSFEEVASAGFRRSARTGVTEAASTKGWGDENL